MSDKKNVILPDGKEIPASGGVHTERSVRRSAEDKEYKAVIIKRNDEAFKHPDDVLQRAIEGGEEQVNRSALSLFLSAVSAGLILGFAAMAVAFVVSVFPSEADESMKRLAMGAVYPLGFIICILSGAELFTEHTALAVYPFLDRLCSFARVLRLWVLVLLGNLVGTLISATLLYFAEPIIGAYDGYIYVAHHLTEFGGREIFVSAMLAGWLMALGGWIILSMHISSAQILSIYIVTFLIGIGGLHHSIAGSAEIFTAFFLTSDITITQITKFLTYAVPGNLVGGSFFVAVLNYAHIRQTQQINLSKDGKKS